MKLFKYGAKELDKAFSTTDLMQDSIKKHLADLVKERDDIIISAFKDFLGVDVFNIEEHKDDILAVESPTSNTFYYLDIPIIEIIKGVQKMEEDGYNIKMECKESFRRLF